MQLTRSLHRLARQSPGALAAVDAETRLDWATLRARVTAMAGALRREGVTADTPVMLLGRNSVAWFEAWFAILWAGGVVVPVNPRLNPREIALMIEDAGADLILCESELADLVGGVPSARILSIGAEAVSWIDGAAPAEDAGRGGDDLAAILYTGGTTGRPKGVMLSHANLLASALGALAMPEMACGPHYLHTAPLSHAGGLSGLLMALLSGSTHYFLPQFEARAVMAAVREYGISDVFLVPTMMEMLVGEPDFDAASLPGLRRIRYGGSSIGPALLAAIKTRLPGVAFSQAYGMTELSPVATILTPQDHRNADPARLRSAGRPTPLVELRIADSHDRGMPTGEVGEVQVRGPNVMRGYRNLPDLTAETLRGGWMRTGDLGFLDAQGYLTIVDRLKDMIVSGGENVYSREVEIAVGTHPDVIACAVVGLPDPRWGERVAAAVVMRDGAVSDADAIRAHCRERIAAFKLPRQIRFLDSLPLTGVGKVDKRAVRDLLIVAVD